MRLYIKGSSVLVEVEGKAPASDKKMEKSNQTEENSLTLLHLCVSQRIQIIFSIIIQRSSLINDLRWDFQTNKSVFLLNSLTTNKITERKFVSPA